MNTLPVKTQAQQAVEAVQAEVTKAIFRLAHIEKVDGYDNLGEVRQAKLDVALRRLREAKAIIGECL